MLLFSNVLRGPDNLLIFRRSVDLLCNHRSSRVKKRNFVNSTKMAFIFIAIYKIIPNLRSTWKGHCVGEKVRGRILITDCVRISSISLFFKKFLLFITGKIIISFVIGTWKPLVPEPAVRYEFSFHFFM